MTFCFEEINIARLMCVTISQFNVIHNCVIIYITLKINTIGWNVNSFQINADIILS